jgi:3-methyladenine DNA glycosylase AlkD
VVARTAAALAAVAVPADAAPMQRYMKDVAPFLGIRTPVRTAALKAAWRDVPPLPSVDELAMAVRALWALPEREHQYAACDLLARYVPKAVEPSFLTDVVQELIVTHSWWDTVDTLRSVAVGPLVLAHRDELAPVMERWSESGDRWLVRSAIIHQLAYKQRTDEALLFALCRRHGGDREFFVAKGIGWALRQYAYTAPDAVRAFVANTPLQPLSVREALKHVGGR